MSEGPGEQPTTWQFEEGAEIVPGRYALKRLGGGRDFEAYLAWDDRLFSLIVAKCVRPHLVADPRALSNLEREADLLLRLAHPVVVRGFDAALDCDRPHIVMEHLEGPNLSSLIRRFGFLTLEQLLPLTLQVCSAIHYLGEEKVVHLDIKPRNIIMGAPPRVIDLSVARSFEKALEISGQVGTDAYMGPEQCDPTRAPIGPAADVWGLGATLYRAVVGEVPFPRPGYDRELHRNDPAMRFPQLTRDPPAVSADVPDAFREVVAACLEPEPSGRPVPAQIVEAIEPLVAALPRKPLLRRPRPGRRR